MTQCVRWGAVCLTLTLCRFLGAENKSSVKSLRIVRENGQMSVYIPVRNLSRYSFEVKILEIARGLFSHERQVVVNCVQMTWSATFSYSVPHATTI